jgi:hypothetical protein
MSGVSYSGINQIQAANKNPEPLKAIFPVEPGGDLIRDIVAPGGALGVDRVDRVDVVARVRQAAPAPAVDDVAGPPVLVTNPGF